MNKLNYVSSTCCQMVVYFAMHHALCVQNFLVKNNKEELFYNNQITIYYFIHQEGSGSSHLFLLYSKYSMFFQFCNFGILNYHSLQIFSISFILVSGVYFKIKFIYCYLLNSFTQFNDTHGEKLCLLNSVSERLLGCFLPFSYQLSSIHSIIHMFEKCDSSNRQ